MMSRSTGWIVGSVAAAVLIGLASPFVTYFDAGQRFVAFGLIVIMFFLLGTGLGWLVTITLARRQQERRRRR
jgi:Na+/melibiose symporter-like transporter